MLLSDDTRHKAGDNGNQRPAQWRARRKDVPRSGAAAEVLASAEFCREVADQLPFLRALVRRWQRDQASADDLVQDTVLQALANRHLWQPGSNLRAWLVTIMRNRFLASVARSSRWASALAMFAATDSGSARDPHEARLTLRDVERALGRLPSKQRAAILSIGVEGKSYEEVARMMATSVGAVRCHLSRGRDRLRTAVYAGGEASPLASRPGAVRLPGLPRPLHPAPSHLTRVGDDGTGRRGDTGIGSFPLAI